jgi:probable F420-dependent oxidoreductase
VKVRIGVGLGQDSDPAGFGATVDRLEAAGIDSLWLSEIVYSRQVDPFVGMAHALGRTARLKVGTGIAVLPGRHPVLVAKQLASLAALAPRRVLPVFGLRPAQRAEWPLFPVPEGRRAAVFDESLRLLRLLLTQDEVTFHGEFHSVTGAVIGPRPAKPLDLWLGGAAPAALDRIGRLADGWLGSFLSPEQSRAARLAIEAAATAAGREVEDDHYGLSLGVAPTGVTDTQLAAARRRRPDTDPTELVADGWPHARTLLEQHIQGGLSKFVIRPLGNVPYDDFLAGFQNELLPLQT